MPEPARLQREHLKAALKSLAPEGGVAAIAVEHFSSGWYLPLVTSIDEDIPYYLLASNVPEAETGIHRIEAADDYRTVVKYCKLAAIADIPFPIYIKRTNLVLNQNPFGMGNAVVLQYASDENMIEAPKSCSLKLIAACIDVLPILSSSTFVFESAEDDGALISCARNLFGDAFPAPPFFPFASFWIKAGNEEFHLGMNAPCFQSMTAIRAETGNYDIWLTPMWDHGNPGDIYGDVIERYSKEEAKSLTEHDLFILDYLGDEVHCAAGVNSDYRLYYRHNIPKTKRSDNNAWLQYKATDNHFKKCDGILDLLKHALRASCSDDALWTTIYIVHQNVNSRSCFPVGVRLGPKISGVKMSQDHKVTDEHYIEHKSTADLVRLYVRRSALLDGTETNLEAANHAITPILSSLEDHFKRKTQDFYTQGMGIWERCAIALSSNSYSRSDKSEFFKNPLHNPMDWLAPENAHYFNAVSAKTEFTDMLGPLLTYWNVSLGDTVDLESLVQIGKAVYYKDNVCLSLFKALADAKPVCDVSASCNGFRCLTRDVPSIPTLGPWTFMFAMHLLCMEARSAAVYSLKIEYCIDSRKVTVSGQECDKVLIVSVINSTGFSGVFVEQVFSALSSDEFLSQVARHGGRSNVTTALLALNAVAREGWALRDNVSRNLTRLCFLFPLTNRGAI